MITLTLTFLLSYPLFSHGNPASSVGSVDMQRAIQATQSGKKAKESLDVEFQKRKAKLDKKKTDIETMGKDLEKKKNLMSEDALQKRQLEIQEEMMKFQKEVADNQMEIQKKEEELVRPIMDKMKIVIEKVAKEKNVSLVFENKGQVLFAAKETDLTDDVVKAFEKEK
jgi:outer membrane protein